MGDIINGMANTLIARLKIFLKTSVYAAKDFKQNNYAMIRQDTGIKSLTGIIKPVPVGGNHECLKHEYN